MLSTALLLRLAAIVLAVGKCEDRVIHEILSRSRDLFLTKFAHSCKSSWWVQPPKNYKAEDGTEIE